jgi:AcrR family transcriptional regulator
MTSRPRKVCQKSSPAPARVSTFKLKEAKQVLAQYSIPSSAKKSQAVVKKQNQIVQGACQVFFKKGFNRTSIREIASACGMSMGQMYHYISSKDDILFLVHKHMHELWIDQLISSGIDAIEDPEMRFREAIRFTVKLISQHRKLFQFVYTESKHLAETHLKMVLDVDEKTTLRFWGELVGALGIPGFGKKEIRLGASVIAFLNVFEALRGWTVKDVDREDLVNFIMDFSIRGVGLRAS